MLRMAIVLTVAASAGADELNVLFYGNSYTRVNDELGYAGSDGVPDFITFMAEAGELTPMNAVNACINGASFLTHVNANTAVIAEGLEPGETWDVVVLQGHSLNATHLGNLPSFLLRGQELFGLVHDHSPDVTGVLFQTWARGPGHVVYPGGFDDPQEMHNEIRGNYMLLESNIDEAYNDAANLSAVGDGFAVLDWATDLYHPDLSHPSPRGTLLASMIIFSTIYGVDAAELDVDFGGDSNLAMRLDVLNLTEEDWAELAGAAAQVGCEADCNGDGRMNILDFVCFQQQWQAKAGAGDCDANGEFDILDFVCYQNLFSAGCP